MASNSTGIYIAAAKSDAELASKYMHLVRGVGFLVTLDWTVNVLAFGGKADDALLDPVRRREFAMLDDRGVERAELFWLLAPSRDTFTRGALFEFGLARGLRKTTLISGPGRADCIFSELASFQYQTHEAAFEALKSWPK